ncbi:hypothetical protein ALP11_03065 [Pseudomonas syringae pv. papulans]|uniref:hypothetical protein n=1 Tax=Pseudomonas syringae TaxID=317 RepID=UPI000EFDEA59|nr:hypothetical protein [Pseudomonas syringae]RMN69074.1 hypothetical protein ALQ56_200297 [Pseudomonas syringae pv. papulans]RMV36750.1 hypothetical protein ALP11_03065 [Pseudomonas syringae pv. papulans]
MDSCNGEVRKRDRILKLIAVLENNQRGLSTKSRETKSDRKDHTAIAEVMTIDDFLNAYVTPKKIEGINARKAAD